VPRIKEQLDINLELACRSDFIPELPGGRERSLFIARHGAVDFYHYDFYSQALAKLERFHARDQRDVLGMLAGGLVDRVRLRAMFAAIEPGLLRYPAIEPGAFARRVAEIATEPCA